MMDKLDIRLEPYEELQEFNGILFPKGPKYRQFVITGPPGSGKSTLMGHLQGWPLEGFLDLTLPNWWRAEILSFRPREVHFGIPYEGHSEVLAVFDKIWLEANPPLVPELDRIIIPPEKRWPLSRDWRHSFIFEFLLPDPERAFEWRKARITEGLFPSDMELSLEQVERQNSDYLQVAALFQTEGIACYVRKEISTPPLRIIIGGGNNKTKHDSRSDPEGDNT